MLMINFGNINRIQCKISKTCTCSYKTPNPIVSPSRTCKRLQVDLLCPVSLQTLQVCTFRGFDNGPLPSPASRRLVRRRPWCFGTSSGSTTRSANRSSSGRSTASSTAYSARQVISTACKLVCTVISSPYSF
jgi:hypothetical protein